jgi:hypothetical protein
MRRRSGKSLRSAVLVAVAVLSLLVAPARAQESEDTGPWREPGINYAEQSKPYIPWLIGALFVVGTLVLAFKNPHRSHLD